MISFNNMLSGHICRRDIVFDVRTLPILRNSDFCTVVVNQISLLVNQVMAQGYVMLLTCPVNQSCH